MTALRPRKKLIEVSIPLEAINKASAKEKSIRYGHPSTLHLWWARRPLAACRAVLFAQLVDDPSAWPDRFPTEAAVETERARLHKVIERFVPWEASNDDVILQEARHEIARSVAWGLDEEPPLAEDAAATLRYLQEKAPPVYDPFSGGGSIPLEAQRLGLRAHGSDLNPVAVLIGKALVEIPPRFAGQPPVNPAARAALPAGGWRGAAGLAEDVRHYGVWMREEAARRIGHLYPKARLPDGGEARVIAWLWARTVRSPDPAAKGAMVPLVSSFLLSTKSGKQSWVKTILDHTAKDGYFFEVQKGLLSKLEEDILKKGTKSTKGGAFTCALTGATIVRDYIQAEGKADRLGQRLMAVVAEGARNRIYLAPDSQHEAVAASVENDPTALEARDTFLSPSTPTRAMITGGVCSAYGFRTWGHLFTPRQLTSLITLSDLVAEVREKVLADAQTAELAPNSTPLHAGGTGATAYADAIATYLGLALDRAVMSGNSLVRWNNVGEKAQHAFGRQAFGMVWDFAEPNFFADSTGSLSSCYEMAANAMLSSNATYGTITCFAAQKYNSELPPSVISTDPPYYDNVAYSELSAFFYPWLKRCISQVWPSEFRRLGVPKDDELVVAPFRHDSREKAEKFFIEGMRDAIVAMKQTTAGDAPIVVYYAFKQSGDEDGATSAGWSSFLQAVIHSGLSVDGTWPLRTEMATRMVGQGANALASSIVLVCRKQATATHVATRAEFIRALRRQLPDAIDDIRKAGVGPVDMQQSIIGPGMGIFTNYSKVLEDDDSIMNVKSALALINRVWGEIANESDASYDAVTQVALAWFATYGFDARPSGELITLANAKDVPLATLFACGVFQDLRGKAGLIARADLPFGWTPAIDKTPTVWECVQHAIRVLNANDGGGEAAAALVAAMGSLAEPARTLAYRLFQIATERGWAAEALAYNALAEEWPRLEAMAPAVTERRPTAAAQASLF